MGSLYIISRSQNRFANRAEAGKLLGFELNKFKRENVVVLGIPRGGLIVAEEIAEALDADIDIVLTHKLRARGNAELAMDSITESGEVFLNDDVIDHFGMPENFNEEKERQLDSLRRRGRAIRQAHSKVPLTGKTVVLADDGIATGSTMEAALWTVRKENPRKIIVVLPVGPEETLVRMTKYADEVICLRVPWEMGSIGQFYIDFNQVEDKELLEVLKRVTEKRRSHA